MTLTLPGPVGGGPSDRGGMRSEGPPPTAQAVEAWVNCIVIPALTGGAVSGGPSDRKNDHIMLNGSTSTWNSTPFGGLLTASTSRSTWCRVPLLSDCNWKWKR